MAESNPGEVLVSRAKSSTDYLGKLVASELDKWGPPVRASGLSAD